MKISREGNAIIPIAFVILGALAVGFIFLTRWLLQGLPEWDGRWIALFWGLAAFVTWCFVVAFFRIPDRPMLSDDSVVFSPCDGTVVVTEGVVENEVTREKRIQVSVFMSTTNVHRNWFPVGGRVTYFKHHHGHFMVAWHPKSSDDNEHTTTAVETPAHGVVVFRQVAGMVARRIVSYARVGEDVVQNTPCGFIKFGSRVDVYLPLDAEISVELGQKVRGGQTPLARLGASGTGDPVRAELLPAMKISGKVAEGSRLGRTLGYPTANIPVKGALDARDGVYVAIVGVGGESYDAMANLGVKPTFSEDGGQRVLELHLFGFEGDLYGRELTAELTRFIRPERKFTSSEELRTQIKKDETEIKRILAINN